MVAESNEAVNNLFRAICAPEAGIECSIVTRSGNTEKMPESVQKDSFEEQYQQKANAKQRQHYDSKLGQEILDCFRVRIFSGLFASYTISE